MFQKNFQYVKQIQKQFFIILFKEIFYLVKYDNIFFIKKFFF